MNYNKDEITILIPCYNEESLIGLIIENFHKVGFSNILVVDDGSKDESSKIASSLNAQVIRNYKVSGLDMAILRGVYEVKTPYTLIFYHYSEEPITPELLEQFIQFGISGRYSLLISKDDSKRSTTLSGIIKKRFGLFIAEPLFDVIFLNNDLTDLIKKKIGGTGYYLFFEIIGEAIKNKLKIGSYSLGISRYRPKMFREKIWMFLNTILDHNPKEYFKYAVPDIEKRERNKTILIIVITAAITFLFDLILRYFSVTFM
ncbi:MAG: glycosyltransferase [bacterium]|nr:glycosyltransferase [bacterium]